MIDVPTSSSASAVEVSIEDWDMLFDSVKARLRLIVDEPRLDAPSINSTFAVAHVRSGVLECVAALDLLQIILAQERRPSSSDASRNDRRARVFDFRAALREVNRAG